MAIFEQQSARDAETRTMLSVCAPSTLLAASNLLGDLALNTANMLVGQSADHQVQQRSGIHPLAPDPVRRLRTQVLGIAAEATAVTATRVAERLAADSQDPDFLATTVSAAAVLGLVRAAGYAEEEFLFHLTQSGLLSRPDKRSELNVVGKTLHFILHEGLQVGAIALGLSLAGGAGFLGSSLGPLGQALCAGLSLDAGRLLMRRLFAEGARERQEALATRREIRVYTQFRPLRLARWGAQRRAWIRFAQELDLFSGTTVADQVIQDKRSALIIKRPATATDPLRGLVFWVGDIRQAGTAYRKQRHAFIDRYFTAAEQERGYVSHLERLDENPEEQSRKLTNALEAKRAVWSLLMGTNRGWDPLQIEIFPNPETKLATYHLSPTLQARRESLGIGEIRSTFTDQGQLSVGIVSFRSATHDPEVLGIGIDLADQRRYWRHAEGDPRYAAKMFFPKEDYDPLYPEGRYPTATAIALRHSVSESLFKALWPDHPRERHHFTMYREFGPLASTSLWQDLTLSGGNQTGLDALGARTAQTRVIDFGPGVLSVVALKNVP